MAESRDSVERASDATQTTGMRAITVSREYGSGGGEIAARLARTLGWRLIDHEVVVEVARRLGVTESDAAQRDEQPESLVDQVLRSFRAVDPTPLSLVGVPDILVTPEAHDYRTALRETVLATAAAGNVVIVGRGSQAILSKRREVLHVRIVAPLAQRILYVSQRESLDPAAAQRRIQKKDHDRQRYLRETHEHSPDDSTLYDIVLNTAVLDLDSCVEIITLAMRRKSQRLALPASGLGPGAGLPAYPGAPEDLPPLAPQNVAADVTAARDNPAPDTPATPAIAPDVTSAPDSPAS
jgi:CMP/dCMP kinase